MPNNRNIRRLAELERFTVYEYIDICTIPKLYYKDKKLFDLIIKKYDIERDFSLVDLNFLKHNYEKFNISMNEIVLGGNLECIKWLNNIINPDNDNVFIKFLYCLFISSNL
jgi:hypothetical protein